MQLQLAKLLLTAWFSFLPSCPLLLTQQHAKNMLSNVPFSLVLYDCVHLPKMLLKIIFSAFTPPAIPSKEEECPSSDACSIVHALPPICFPHSTASAEMLRRLKGQIAHTKRERTRVRKVGAGEQKIWRDEKTEGEEKG